MRIGPIQIETNGRRRAARLKQAVLSSFYEPAPSIQARLREFSVRDWKRAKYWLDVSGLALYFLERIETMKLQACLPESLLLQLRTNLDENRKRTVALLDEAVKVTHALRQLNVACAVLKGVTLPSESVPDPSYRNQMDLDLLIRESAIGTTQDCLAAFGYSLDASSSGTWEFKAGPSGTSSLKNLYQVRPERVLEVHLQHDEPNNASADRLARVEWRLIHGRLLPALSPAELFVLQGRHLFKHMCGEYTRACWVLEFWRHICARREDAAFWREVECVAAEETGSATAVGAALLLTSLAFSSCAPVDLAGWSMDKLPSGVCLWIHLYGRRILLSDRPGSKLYLLLRKELSPDSPADRSERRRLLLPFHWPQKITRAAQNESLLARILRSWVQMRFATRRLRFHVWEGFGLAIESSRWQRRSGGLS
jgi:hypothetical protein